MEARISMVTLGVADLEGATRFYADGLGLPLRSSDEAISFFDLNGTWLALYPWDKLAEDAEVGADGTAAADGAAPAHGAWPDGGDRAGRETAPGGGTHGDGRAGQEKPGGAGTPAKATPHAAFRGVTLAHNVSSPEEVEVLLKQAVDAGATLVKPGQEVFWGGYSGYFADPDGHLWEVAHNPFTWIGPPPEGGSAGY